MAEPSIIASGATFSPYCGPAPVPEDLLTRWTIDPMVLIALLGATGLAILRGRSHGVRSGWAVAACAALAVSFVSPLCALSAALFSARTAHHVVLMAAAAPLLALALPKRQGALALPTLAQAIVLWLWHAPALYAAALSDDAIYWAMQLSLFASAVAFWRGVRGVSPPSALAALLVTTLQMGLLGALLTFAPAPLYAPHLATTLAWGLSPLDDQRLGGLIMWAPASGLYLLAALASLHRAFPSAPRPA